MTKGECNIVKDILPIYVENQVSDETKEFVNKHIRNCNECGENLKMLKGEQGEEEKRKSIEEFEIDFLKKYNTKMRILEVIAAILAIAIIVAWIGMFGRGVILENKRIKRQQEREQAEQIKQEQQEIANIENRRTWDDLHDIIDVMYKNINKAIEGNNFVYEEEFRTKDYKKGIRGITNTKYFYKDGKFKEESSSPTKTIEQYTIYGVKWQGDLYNVQLIEGKNPSYNTIYSGGRIYNKMFSKIEQMYQKKVEECSNIEIREDKQEEKEYYVIKEVFGEEYNEMWIEKDNMKLTKIIYIKVDKFDEFEFSFKEGIATD